MNLREKMKKVVADGVDDYVNRGYEHAIDMISTAADSYVTRINIYYDKFFDKHTDLNFIRTVISKISEKLESDGFSVEHLVSSYRNEMNVYVIVKWD